MIFLEDLIIINSGNEKDYTIKQNLKVLSLNKYLLCNDKASLTYLLSKEKNLHIHYC